jgi:hypothetical protein
MLLVREIPVPELMIPCPEIAPSADRLHRAAQPSGPTPRSRVRPDVL